MHFKLVSLFFLSSYSINYTSLFLLGSCQEKNRENKKIEAEGRAMKEAFPGVTTVNVFTGGDGPNPFRMLPSTSGKKKAIKDTGQ